jgi:hypothetical protein
MGQYEHGLAFSYPYELDELDISDIDTLSQLGVPSSFQHIHFIEDRSLERLLFRLNNEVGEARREFPHLRYVRSFRLPSSHHKRQYLMMGRSVDESWLESAFLAFRETTARPHWIREEYANASWKPYRAYTAAHVNIDWAVSLVREAAFLPYLCQAKLTYDDELRSISYNLADKRGKIIAQGQVSVFSSDLWEDFESAILEERARLEGNGLTFDPPTLDLLATLNTFE